MTIPGTTAYLAGLDAAIHLERALARLYRTHAEHISVDADFWWKLAGEEENHAALIRSLMESFHPLGYTLPEILDPDLDRIASTIKLIEDQTTLSLTKSLSRVDALLNAILLEQSSTESHLQLFLDLPAQSPVAEVFQKLAAADSNHAVRIQCHMRTVGIPTSEFPL